MLVELVQKIVTHKLLSTTESFSAVTRASSKSHTTPHTKCVTILYKYDISESSPHKRTFEHHRVFLDMTRAPSKLRTTPDGGEINSHRRTSEHH